MDHYTYLQTLQTELVPETYLEIGVETGRSLSYAKCRAIGIDPLPRITHNLHPDSAVFAETSDDFFAKHDVLSLLGGRRLDMVFLDGMHLFEYTLRDFMNVEPSCHAGTVICVHDVMPQTVRMASREPQPDGWTGDVFKIVLCLRKYRPDLFIAVLDVDPTGILLIGNLDPTNRALHDNYDAIVAEYAEFSFDDVASLRDAYLKPVASDHVATNYLIAAARMQKASERARHYSQAMCGDSRVNLGQQLLKTSAAQ
jgi:hypothetical protein